MAEDNFLLDDQLSVDRKEYEDYWCEYNHIKKSDSIAEVYLQDEAFKSDDIENEMDWLIETGFDFLLSYSKDGREDPVIDYDLNNMISTLTTKQAETVKKRIATYKGSISQRNCLRNPPDVRDVFPKEVTIVKDERIEPGGFHCHIGNDNRTEISLNPPFHSANSSDGPIISDFSKKNFEITFSKPNTQICDGKYLTVSKDRRSRSKYDPKRNSLPEAIGFISNFKHEYSVRDNQFSSSENLNAKSNVCQEKFTYNGEFHSQISQFPKRDNSDAESRMENVHDGGRDEENFPILVVEDLDSGITAVNDFSTEDMVKVRQLSLIELTGLFDSLDISYFRRKSPKKKHKGGVFGSTLNSIMVHEQKKDPSCKVPKFMQMLVSQIIHNGLEEKGILRVPGSFTKIESIRNKVETQYLTSPELIQEIIMNSSARDCAALLKHFVRDLAEPLLTNSYLEAFLQVHYISTIVSQVEALNLLILILPDFHRDLLECVLVFLEKIISYEHINSMNLHNVAMIMAPNLFLPRNKKTNNGAVDEKTNFNSIEDEIVYARITCHITELLIKYRHVLWTVPGFLLKQVRQQNEAVKEKSNSKEKHRKKKVTEKLAVMDKNPSLGERPVTLIKVSTSIPKVGVFCPLDDNLTAGDVVLTVINEIQAKSVYAKNCNDKARPKSISQMGRCSSPCMLIAADKSVFVAYHYLCEVGGNIGQRRLHHDVKVGAVLEENPLTEWIVKCYHN